MKDNKLDIQHTQSRVGVIIVNWNSFDVLGRCLEALKHQVYVPACVVVVDNDSDDAPEHLDLAMPDNTYYLRLASNTGFAHANNIAVTKLKDCDWIALINPDAFPEPDWLAELVAAARRRPKYSFFSSMTISDQDPDYLDGTGDVYHISGIAWRRGFDRSIAATRLTEEEVFAPCAAAAMYKRSAWEEAGGFDEDFFCYFEDVDLAFRLRLLGYRCLFVPTAIAYHVGSITTGGQQSDFSVYHGHRNLVWTFIKDMPGYAFWLLLPLHVAMNLFTVLRFMLIGRSEVIFRAKLDAIKGIKTAWSKRKQIQAQRRVPVRDILRYMDKRIIPARRLRRVLGLEGRQSSLADAASQQSNAADPGAGNHENYFNYLRKRSLSGLLYRRCCLYPRLSHHTQGRVLDVGCGIGDYVAYRQGAIGVDVNRHAVDWCRKRGLDVRLMEEDRLPFGNASFDSVVLDNVLEHLKEPAGLLSEIARVLDTGGRVVIGVPGKLGYMCDADHKIYYDEARLRATLENAGFRQATVFHMPLKWDWLDSRLPQYCLYGVFVRA